VESNEPNEREKKLAQKIFDELFKRFTAVFLDAKLGITEATDQAECVIYQALAAYRAELAAPARDDREAADIIGVEVIDIVEEFMKDNIDRPTARDRIGDKIADALHAARQAEQAKGEALKAAELEFVRTTGLLVADYATMGKATPERQEQYILARDALVALVGREGTRTTKEQLSDVVKLREDMEAAGCNDFASEVTLDSVKALEAEMTEADEGKGEVESGAE